MRTGTANYLDKLMAATGVELAKRDDVCIIIDRASHPEPLPESFHGIPVIDVERIPSVVPNDELWFIFLANNTFHAYTHRLLDDCTAAAGRVITVVHEPANYMLLRHLSYHGQAGFTVDRLLRGMEVQYGGKAGRFLQDTNAGLFPQMFDYFTNAQLGLYANSSEIWTHSMYAAQRLRAENLGEVPPIKVWAHPHTPFSANDDFARLPSDLQKKDGVFRIGVFGWVSESKRVSESIEALGLALDRLPPEAEKQIELYVVGQLPPAGGYDPIHAASEANVSVNVRFLSYVENRNFELLFKTCDCILNLRFPSCGETSGTLALAHSAGVQVIKSNYQAMHEETASMSVSTLPFFEVATLASLISKTYLNWSSKDERSAGMTDNTAPSFGCPVEKALLLEVRKHRLRYDVSSAAPRRSLA
jgi:glycosyltransferase involved in cell wall biosynthesis